MDSIKLRLKRISATNINRPQANLHAKISIGGAEDSKKKTSICSVGQNSELDLSIECTYTINKMAVREGNASLMVKLYRKRRWFSWLSPYKYMGNIDVRLVELYDHAGGTGKRKTQSYRLTNGTVASPVELQVTYEFVDFKKDRSAKWKKGLKYVGKVVVGAVVIITSCAN